MRARPLPGLDRVLNNRINTIVTDQHRSWMDPVWPLWEPALLCDRAPMPRTHGSSYGPSHGSSYGIFKKNVCVCVYFFL